MPHEPNIVLKRLIAACGKLQTDLAKEAFPGAKTGDAMVSRYTQGKDKPSQFRAEAICTVLSSWSGREVPVALVFPVIGRGEHATQYTRPPRDEAAIEAILTAEA